MNQGDSRSIRDISKAQRKYRAFCVQVGRLNKSRLRLWGLEGGNNSRKLQARTEEREEIRPKPRTIPMQKHGAW
jgi:hypothetical protein